MKRDALTDQADFRRRVDNAERETDHLLSNLTSEADAALVRYLRWRIEDYDYNSSFAFKAFPNPQTEKQKYRDLAHRYRQLVLVVAGKRQPTPAQSAEIAKLRQSPYVTGNHPVYDHLAAQAERFARKATHEEPLSTR